MSESPPHPSQLPADWSEQVARAYEAFAVRPVVEKRGSKNQLRTPAGQFTKRRNTVESMINAPSPYKATLSFPAPLHNIVRLDGLGLPDDVYEHLSDYMDHRPGSDVWNRETTGVVEAARGNPELPVQVYRPVPLIVNQFTPSDIVLLSPAYANYLAGGRPRWRVISGTVPAYELFTRGKNQLMRWEWRGKQPFTRGGISKSLTPRGRR